MKIEELHINQEVWCRGEKWIIKGLTLDSKDEVSLQAVPGSIHYRLTVSVYEISLIPPKKKVKREMKVFVYLPPNPEDTKYIVETEPEMFIRKPTNAVEGVLTFEEEVE